MSATYENQRDTVIDPLDHLIKQTDPIDLLILLRILHKTYPEAGKRAGAINRYIKHFKETYEPDIIKTKTKVQKFQSKLNQLLNK